MTEGDLEGGDRVILTCSASQPELKRVAMFLQELTEFVLEVKAGEHEVRRPG